MAALLDNSFTLLLRADSEQPLPDTDIDVVAAPDTYGTVFKKTKNLKEAPARLELPTGAHQHDLLVVWSAAPAATLETSGHSLFLPSQNQHTGALLLRLALSSAPRWSSHGRAGGHLRVPGSLLRTSPTDRVLRCGA
jgi:hypothetical protein